jgi:predicted nucleic acid-binding Zn ribbon protein
MSRRAPYRKFRKLGSVLPKVVRQLKLGEVVAAQPAVSDWAQIAGEKVAQHTRALSVDQGVLLVAADSPAWLTQLAYLKPQLIRSVCRRTGGGVIKDIRFVLSRDRT